MGDGGIDFSKKDLEIIYVRMFCNGEFVNKYFKIVELFNGIVDGVIVSFDEVLFKVRLNDWRNGLVFIGFDGVLVYIGVRNGVVVKFKQFVLWFLGIYCIVYNLELVRFDGIKDEILFMFLRDMFQLIYKYYYYFFKVFRELREFVEVMGEKI